jgi:hypothetical protein
MPLRFWNQPTVFIAVLALLAASALGWAATHADGERWSAAAIAGGLLAVVVMLFLWPPGGDPPRGDSTPSPPGGQREAPADESPDVLQLPRRPPRRDGSS